MSEYQFTTMTNLAAERLGARTLLCSDDFFAEKENLLKPGRGTFIEDKYTDRGKWMDGWESRRNREPGNDWCIIQLAAPGKISGVDIDTNYFIGNYPPHASIEAFNIKDVDTDDFEALKWVEILPISPLQPGAQNLYPVTDADVYTHLRLHIYPDGGVARLKVYGEVMKDWSREVGDEPVDLAAAKNGGKTVSCSDMFFGSMDNLLLPDGSSGPGDGWQTQRSRVANHADWVIVRLACGGQLFGAGIDTTHFKGNYPERCMLEAGNFATGEEGGLSTNDADWTPLLPEQPLGPDKEHLFEFETGTDRVFTHVRLTIFPDGGISRLRIFGNTVVGGNLAI